MEKIRTLFGGAGSIHRLCIAYCSPYLGRQSANAGDITHLGFKGSTEAIGLLFAYFFGFFLMLICFGINPWLSIIGGLALGLSSYFLLIIPAGHMTKATAIGFLLLLCLTLILGTKWSWMQMNNSYLKETMRGGHSELKQAEKTDTQKAGLDIKYATDWSYGKAETLTLLVPNFMGGASGYNVGDKSVLYEELVKARYTEKQRQAILPKCTDLSGERRRLPAELYMSELFYVSCSCLGLLIVPGPYKWALLFATLMSIFLAWGKNMMWLTELFFNYFPMYNKFRAVESILVVAEITMPLLGFMALQQIWEHREEKSPYKKQYLLPEA